MNNTTKIKLYFLLAAIFISRPVISDFYVGHTGKVLVASSRLSSDPNFKNTVIYIFDHSIWGAKGIILNKPIENKNDFFKDDTSFPAYKGGPVFFPNLRVAAIVHSKAVGRWRTQDLFVFDYRGIDEILSQKQQTERDDIRIYVGITGWGFNQLEKELKMGLWDVVDFDSTYLESPNLWDKLRTDESNAERQ
jgi:putative transcriptional regulator